MTVAGLVRLRKHQFGRQDVFGTKVAATRAYAFRGVPSTDLQWTDPDVDVGSIVPTVAPGSMPIEPVKPWPTTVRFAPACVPRADPVSVRILWVASMLATVPFVVTSPLIATGWPT